MIKGFIVSIFMSVAGASLALAQTPDVSPYNPLHSGRASTERTEQAGAAVQLETRPAPFSSGVQDGAGGACNDDSCRTGAEVCGPPGRVWVDAEYLLWWVKGAHLPPLVTTGSADPTQIPPPGALGGPGTVGLFAGDGVERDPFSGGRFTAGYWLDCGQTKGIEASYFFLGSRSNDFTANSSGAPGSRVLARPFFDVSTGLPNSELIAFPGLASGAVSVTSTTELQGAEANLICNLCCSCGDCGDCCGPARSYRVDLIGGFRYLDLREGLGVVENSMVLPTSPALAGDAISAFDQFDTRNQFYGGQLGVRAEVRQNRLFANLMGKLAIGDTHETVDVNGATTITAPGGPAVVRSGGLLALPSNIGRFSRDVFSVVPEGSLNVGYQVTNNLRVYVGYTFLYWSDVVRPGDAIDLRVNSTRVPTSLTPPSGPVAPLFAAPGSDFWAQGIDFGVELRF